MVTFKLRNGLGPLSEIVNYTDGATPKPILTHPINGTVPTDIVYDGGRNRVWFLADQNLTYYDPVISSTVTEHIFSGDSPFYMTIDHSGMIWITLLTSNRVAEYDPLTKSLIFYRAPTVEAGLQGIAVAPDNSVWFAEPNGTRLGHIVCQTTSCTVSEFAAPPEIHVGFLIQVAVGFDGTVWFTDHGSGEFGSFDPSTNEWQVFPIGYCSESYNPECGVGLPNAIAFDSSGRLWFSEHYAGRVAEYDPAKHLLIEYVVPATAPPYVWWMQPGPGDLVWFAAFGSGQIGFVKADKMIPIFVNATAIVELKQGQTATVDASVTTLESPVSLNATANGNDAPYGELPALYTRPTTSQIAAVAIFVHTSFRITAAWNLSPGDRYIALSAYNASVLATTFVRIRVIAQYYLPNTFVPFLGLGSVSAIAVGTSALYMRRIKSRDKDDDAIKSQSELSD